MMLEPVILLVAICGIYVLCVLTNEKVGSTREWPKVVGLCAGPFLIHHLIAAMYPRGPPPEQITMAGGSAVAVAASCIMSSYMVWQNGDPSEPQALQSLRALTAGALGSVFVVLLISILWHVRRRPDGSTTAVRIWRDYRAAVIVAGYARIFAILAIRFYHPETQTYAPCTPDLGLWPTRAALAPLRYTLSHAARFAESRCPLHPLLAL